jgi:hypothetical protein
MIDLVKPPTDNLYKFIALAGLVLVVLGVIYAPWLFYRSTWETLKLEQLNAELKVHRKFAEERQKTLDARKQQLEAERDTLKKRIAELVFVNDKNNNPAASAEIDRLETRVRETNAAADALADAEHEKNLSLELKEAQAEHQRTVEVNERENTRLIMKIGIPLAIAGLGVSVLGFRLWYKRITIFQDAIVVIEATSKITTLSSGQTEDSD